MYDFLWFHFSGFISRVGRIPWEGFAWVLVLDINIKNDILSGKKKMIVFSMIIMHHNNVCASSSYHKNHDASRDESMFIKDHESHNRSKSPLITKSRRQVDVTWMNVMVKDVHNYFPSLFLFITEHCFRLCRTRSCMSLQWIMSS